ncbi:flagellar biosynthesis protein FlhF [Thiopseudomonas denitrificans]|uniref:Flagellar biosynthesis protein FlhF n=2 Tax=Thiopseudomonas denitrificans TaxID=1501432 RepID=A0A4R6U0T7_9GAMM|nr:flagellar biosynthesis protein FlhF [Thiopseudomonas denitrificans]
MAMQVKRFFAADMRQAMNRVKEELGADAAILSTRRLAGGVELTAALDYSAQPLPARANPELEAELRKTSQKILSAKTDFEQRAQIAAGGRDRQLLDSVLEHTAEVARLRPDENPAQSRSAADQQELAQMRSELMGLRELIELQMGNMGWQGLRQQQPGQAALWRKLQQMGLPADVISSLMKKIPQDLQPRQAWKMVLALLARSVQTPKDEPVMQGGVIALVGPAGMGKTTTLAKLAARYVLEHGAQNIAIVSMDSYRIGAQEQLKTLGRILNVPVSHVEAGQSLEQALLPLAKKRIVLVDTAGLPASDPQLTLQLDNLTSRKLPIRNYLVLAATSQAQVLKAAWHAYKRCGLAGCIITKLDEAVSMGEVLGMAIGQGLAVAYTTDGPKIPDDIQVSRSHQLVSRAVRMQNPDEPGEEVMAELYAGVCQKARHVV